MASEQRLFLVLLLFAGMFCPLQAQDDVVAVRERELSRINSEISRLENMIETVNRQESTTITLIEKVKNEKRLHQAQYDRLTLQINQIEDNIQALNQEISASEQRITELSKSVKSLLLKLYKRGSRNYLQLLLAMESMESISLAQAYLSHLVGEEVELIESFNHEIAARKESIASLSQEQQKLTTLQKEARDKLQLARKKESEQQQYLKEIRQQTGIYSRSLADKRKAREELQQLITDLARQRERESTSPSLQFARLKGSLIWPVKGEVITPFGTVRDSVYNVSLESDGIEIKADIGEPVRSVAAGTIIFSDWHDMGGNMVVIDHGNRYYTIYAHLSRIITTKDANVSAGDVIGEVGDSASLKGPMLKFEIRHINASSQPTALNPRDWLQK